MYLVPIVILIAVILGLGAWVSPIFALIVAVPLALLFFAYVGLSRRSDQKVAPPGTPEPDPNEVDHGIWGER